MTTPDLGMLLRRLLVLAGNVRDQLSERDWEAAIEAQETFDESFAMLVRMRETGHEFTGAHANDLAQLQHVHAENLVLAQDLKRTAGIELGHVSKVQRINSAYSPLGQNHRPSPRYVDGSA